jgi:hypothetical protein
MIETRWIRVERDQRDGKACRVITLSSATGEKELEAVAFAWERDIVVTATSTPASTATASATAAPPSVDGFVIRRRRTFPFTGRLDVLAGPSETRIAILNRNGVVLDGAGNAQGRFRDARSMGQRAGQGAFEVVGAILTGTEGGDPGQMPLERRWIVGGAEQGRLMRAKWPFDRAETEPGSSNAVSRLLPAKVRAFLRGVAAPATWRFDWRPLEPSADPSVDPRLPLAAAIWAVELSHW